MWQVLKQVPDILLVRGGKEMDRTFYMGWRIIKNILCGNYSTSDSGIKLVDFDEK